MNRFFLVAFFSLSSLNLLAQTADWIFNPEINRPDRYHWNNHAWITNTLTDPDNGDIYLLTRLTDTVSYSGIQFISKSSSHDLLLIKLNVAGQIAWTKQIGDIHNEYGGSLSFINDELLLSMHFGDFTNLGGQTFSSSNGKVLLAHISKVDGSIMNVEQKNIKGTASSTFVTPNNEIYVAGLFTVNSSLGPFSLPDPYIRDIWGNQRPSSYVYLAKLTSNKSPLWIKHSVHGFCCVTPRFSKARMNPVNGDVVMIGYSAGPIGFEGNYISGRGFFHSYMACYDRNGRLKWTQKGQAAGRDSMADVFFFDLDFDTHGNIYLTGTYNDQAQLGSFRLIDENGTGYENGFVSKLDQDGNFVWAKAILGGRSTHTTTVECIENDCYFGGSFRDYLKFDTLGIVQATGSPLSMGFIGKIEDGSKLNKLLLVETAGTAALANLDEHLDGYILGSGSFYYDISIGCVSKAGGTGIPYVSRINLANEIDAPLISGPGRICIGEPYYLTINNYDPNYSYQVNTPSGVVVKGQINNVIELSVDSTAPAVVNVTSVAINNCNWRAISEGLTFVVDEPPTSTGEIVMPSLLCEGQEDFTVSVNPMVGATSYHWTLPGVLTEDNEIVTGTHQIILPASTDMAFGEITVSGSNHCGTTRNLTAPLTIVSKIQDPVIAGEELICNNNSENNFIVKLEEDLVGDVVYYWEVSDDLMFLNNQRHAVTHNNEISVRVDEKFNVTNQWIKVRAENGCYSTEPFYMELQGSNLAEVPHIKVSECDQFIQVDLEKDFEWFRNDDALYVNTSTIEYPDPGHYKVKSKSMCDTKWSEEVSVNPVKLEKLMVPNVITPNGDNFNELFVLDPQLESSYLCIYNRWGNKVYESHNYQNDWNGEHETGGVYYYIIKNRCLNGAINGNITVIK